MKEAHKVLNRNYNEDNSFSANVCVICDWYIIGTEKICYVNDKILLKNESRLSVHKWKEIYSKHIPEKLRLQYKINDTNDLFKDMLLSPLAKKTDKGYTCRKKCYCSLQKPYGNPPKYAIANGWAIGYLPDDEVNNVEPVPDHLNNVSHCSCQTSR